MTPSDFYGFIIFVGFWVLVYCAEAALLIRAYAFRVRGKPLRLLTKPAIFIHIAACIGCICFLYGYFIEPYRIKIARVKVFTHKISRRHFRLVQFSDTHCTTRIGNEKRAADIINKLSPDAVLFTGDAVNAEQGIALFKSMLASINAPVKYAVLGNADVHYWTHTDLLFDTGFRNLDNECAVIKKDPDILVACGLNYTYWSIDEALFASIPKEFYRIFLYHSPALIERMAPVTDLYVCGHTHGGQVALPGYGAIITLSRFGKKYESGPYLFNKTIAYVNNGLGMERGFLSRIRFLARPEITVFDIYPERAFKKNKSSFTRIQ